MFGIGPSCLGRGGLNGVNHGEDARTAPYHLGTQRLHHYSRPAEAVHPFRGSRSRAKAASSAPIQPAPRIPKDCKARRLAGSAQNEGSNINPYQFARMFPISGAPTLSTFCSSFATAITRFSACAITSRWLPRKGRPQSAMGASGDTMPRPDKVVMLAAVAKRASKRDRVVLHTNKRRRPKNETTGFATACSFCASAF